MCSVSDDIEELNVGDCSSTDQSITEETSQGRSLNLCKKCGEQAVVVLQKKDPFCKPCFLTYCNHKFRATIGKSKKIKPGSRVLICHSGGLSSTAMLHMLIQALTDSSPKRLMLKPGILHISENYLTHTSTETEAIIKTTIQKDAQALDCEILFSSIDMSFREDENTVFYWDSAAEHRDETVNKKFMDCLKGIKSLSSKQEFVEIVRKQLMIDIAKSSGYSHLFVGDSATSLANNVLTSIALGRGSQISNNVVFEDIRHEVSIYRPLREFLKKELAFYNEFNDLQYFVQPSLLTMTDEHSSIQRLTEKFVSGLQENFPATVFTIFRTGGKVAANFTTTEKCIFCESALDNVNPPICSALEAMELTSKLSGCDLSEDSHNSCDEMKSNTLKQSLKHCVCHGCQVLLNEMTCFHIPTSTFRKVVNHSSKKDIHNEIKEYLLEDADGENDIT